MTKKPETLSQQPLKAASEAVLPTAVWSKHRVLVAVSGGADSVALFRTIHELRNEMAASGVSPEIVHVNHGIRGANAQRDADFVKKFAVSFGSAFHLKHISWTDQNAAEFASENALRQLRYEAIMQVAKEIGARYVFTGHHRDDQVETILFRIFRGTGLAGLRGIPPVRVVDQTVSVVRPLLEVSREMIIAALGAWGQEFCHDQSNDADDYSRNYLRNKLLPQVRSYFGQHVDDSIMRLSQHACDAVEAETRLIDDFLQAIPWSATQKKVELPIENLRALPPATVRSTLLRIWKQNQWPLSGMTYGHWCEITELVFDTTAEKMWVKNLPGDIRLEVDGQTLRLSCSAE